MTQTVCNEMMESQPCTQPKSVVRLPVFREESQQGIQVNRVLNMSCCKMLLIHLSSDHFEQKKQEQQMYRVMSGTPDDVNLAQGRVLDFTFTIIYFLLSTIEPADWQLPVGRVADKLGTR